MLKILLIKRNERWRENPELCCQEVEEEVPVEMEVEASNEDEGEKKKEGGEGMDGVEQADKPAADVPMEENKEKVQNIT